MFIPVGDTPNPRGTPWVTWTLIGLNVLVYLALLPASLTAADPRDPALLEYLRVLVGDSSVTRTQLAQLAARVSVYDLLVFEHGFRPGAPGLVDAFTSMFLHGGLMHLAGNMLFLWIYGDNVEHRLGPSAYLLLYLGTGLAAVGGDALLRAGSDVPTVGASGAISGVLGAYFLWFPRNRVRVFVLLPFLLFHVFEVPARLVLGFYILVDNLLPVLVTGGAGGGVAYGAHIGGFVGGLAAAWVIERRAAGRPRMEGSSARAQRSPPAGRSDGEDPARALSAALDAGRLDTALSILLDTPRRLTRAGIAGEEKLRLADALRRAGHPRAALGVYQRVLADHPSSGLRARAHLGAAAVQMRQLGMETAAYQHLYEALEEAPADEERALALQLLDELQRRTASLPRPPGTRGP